MRTSHSDFPAREADIALVNWVNGGLVLILRKAVRAVHLKMVDIETMTRREIGTYREGYWKCIFGRVQHGL